MRLYNFYRLVRTDEGRVITGEELKAILTAEGFTIPALLPFPKWILPPQPGTPGAAEAGIYSWPDYYAKSYEGNLIYKAQEAEYWDQFVTFADVLEADFEVARYVKDGNVREYRTGLEVKRTWEWFSRTLMQNYQGNYIQFICNGRF